MLKILQARLQQYVNQELSEVQTRYRNGRGTRDQIANIHWILKKAKEFHKNIHFCFTDYAKTFDCVDYNKILKDMNTRQPYLSPGKPVCESRSNRTRLLTDSKLGKEYVKAVYCNLLI